jgi:hypothetical protein
MTDLALFDTAAACETPFDIELMWPKTKAPLGLFIQVIGYNSGPLRAITERREAKQRHREFALQRGEKIELPSLEEENAEGLEALITATVGWYERKRDKDGKLGKKQEGLPFGETRLMFSKEEAEKLYKHPGYQWIGTQIVQAVYDIGNFIKA